MLGYIISGNNIINIEKHEIFSFNILHKTNLNIFVVKDNVILYRNNIIFNASRYGHVEILEWFKNSGYEFKYDENAINLASKSGHVTILEWFKNSDYEFKHDKYVIMYASLNGHVKILEWFKNSGYEFKYHKHAINYASVNGHIKILEWFNYLNVKKVIKWSNNKFTKTIKFKTKNNYLKGYNKN